MSVVKCKYCNYPNFGSQDTCIKCHKSLKRDITVNSGMADDNITKHYHKVDDDTWLRDVRSKFGDKVYEKAKKTLKDFRRILYQQKMFSLENVIA